MLSEVRSIIEGSCNAEIAQGIIGSYLKLEESYATGNRRTAGLDGGHFVEAVRRFLDYKLHGTYVPLGKSLPPFDYKFLNSLLLQSGEDSYRMHIPGILIAIYGLRNKRGVGHLTQISANQKDALFTLNSAKWVLAETIGINSTYDASKSSSIVDQICSRRLDGVWFDGEHEVVLATNITLREKIVLFLMAKSESDSQEIQIATDAGLKYLKRILRSMREDRLVVFRDNDRVVLTPVGISWAESEVLPKLR